MKSFLFLLLFVFSFLTPGISQPASHFTIRYYTTENGLPSNGIKGLQWDEKTSFLWMATEAGIVRFNGIDFNSYTKENTSFIKAERMQFLIRNVDGDIYACDQVGNLINIKNNILSFKKKVDQETSNTGYSIYGLVVSDTFFRYRLKNPSTELFIIRFDKLIPLTDTSLIAIKGKSVYYNTLSITKPEMLDFNGIEIVDGFMLDNKCFLVSDNREIYQLDVSTKKLSLVAIDATPSEIKKIRNNKTVFLWESSQSKPVLIFENTAWQLLFDGKKLVADEICNAIPAGIRLQYAQYSQEKKLLFLGTNSKGLIVINANKVQPVKKVHSEGNERNAYYSQIELPNGNVLTNEGHVVGLNAGSTQELPLKGKFGFNISKTRDSLLWYTNFETGVKFSTLHRYNIHTGITLNYPKIKANNHFVITLKNNKTIILNEKGIGELRNDSLHYQYLFKENRLKSLPSELVETETDIVVFSVSDAVIRFNTSSLKVDTLLHHEDLSIRTLLPYKDYLIAGTYGNGFYIVKGNKAKAMPLDKNKFLLYTHCFMLDKLGFCWISTNRGLFKVNLDELLNSFNKNNNTVYYHYLGKNDGMDITEMNGGCTPCAITLKNGTISFPTMDGLLWVSPEQANIVLPDGDIYIDEVVADNKKFSFDSLSVKNFDFKTKEIKFYLGYSAWCNSENIYIDYKLNEDIEWTSLNPGNGSIIRFSNLPQGRYILQIRKLNGFGINNYSYKEIRFSINTPWHKTWWFYTLCALVIAGVVLLYLRLRTRQFKLRQKNLEIQVDEKTKELQQKNVVLEKSNSINTRLISIISHDIITPLKFLTVAGKNLKEKRNQMPEELQQETINEITNTSQELQLLSTNILNWIKYQNENRRLLKESFNLFDLVNQVLSILQSLAKQKGLSIENKVDPELSVYQFYEPLKILIYNLLTNSIRFTETGIIEVNASASNGQITVSVNDQGIGMSPEKIKSLMEDDVVITSSNVDNKKGHGLGYLIIKDLLKTMGATLHIESKKGEGSKVSIRFGVNNIGI